jgi:hypothetical protein
MLWNGKLWPDSERSARKCCPAISRACNTGCRAIGGIRLRKRKLASPARRTTFH